ncbi:hypothetical protein [Methylobacterium symbioticum]|jgi:hypothetical protein|uniref:Uncharacterized protein n=1 Tax=Methylobacterium symbioticum TaxID=2584084 RepID=A0A509ELH1_9HYPH|nr:hypothetical protein [Methylobacterium symbioticum]VUD74103.1 hypothetical protein MET9862_04728 [Methylobacterium symbioticum]
MILILAAALISGFGSVAIVVWTSPLLALVIGPIVGSVASLLAAFYLAWRRGSHLQNEAKLSLPRGSMVSALRDVARKGHASAGPS